LCHVQNALSLHVHEVSLLVILNVISRA